MRSSFPLCAAVAALFALWAAPAGAATFTSPGFESVTLAGGLTQPTAVAYAPDGRMFIALKQGTVREVTAAGHLLSAPVLDISAHVTSNHDRGLLGIALDKSFATNHYMYLLYTCCNPALTDTDPAVARLTRVTVGGPAGETRVLGWTSPVPCTRPPSNTEDCIPSDGYTHSIGTVRVDPNDGSLWVSVGDAQSDNVAYQDATDALNPNSMAGKILHVDQRPGHLGDGMPGNPFCADTDLSHTCTKVFAKGFRNPFRFTLRQVGGVSRPVAGDVGLGHWEEINLVTPGYNGGWPCYEGDQTAGAFLGFPPCNALPLNPPNINPAYQYSHFSDECTYASPPNPCNLVGINGAVAGGPVMTGSWPGWNGKLFFTDYVHGFIKTLDPNAPPARGMAPDFATGLGHPVFLDQIPAGAPGAGNLVYVDIANDAFEDGSGSVREIRPTGGNVSPIPEATSSANCGNPGLSIQFTGDASSDPDGDLPLSYHWDFGDGIGTSSSPNPSYAYPTAGDYIAQLTVTDARGASQSAFVPVAVHLGAAVPDASVAAPTPGDQYVAGAATHISGNSTTAGSTWRWQVLLNHGGSHVHVIGSFDVTTMRNNPLALDGTDDPGDLSFLADDAHGVGSYYVLRFTASKGGCTKTIERQMIPQAGNFDLAAFDDQQPENSIPVPLTFANAGEAQTYPAPKRLSVAKRANATISAPQVFTDGGYDYTFHDWSDGGASSHAILPYGPPANLGDDPQSLTVHYVRSNTAPTPSILSPADGASYISGETVTLHGSAVDAQDGPVDPGSLHWQIVRHSRGVDTALPAATGASTSFTTDTGSDTAASYTVALTATDTIGATSAPATITLRPTPAGRLTLASSPAGAPLTFNGTAAPAPSEHVLLSGSSAVVGAPGSFVSAGKVRLFSRWSDGGSATHTVVGSGTDTTLTASYALDGAPPKLLVAKPAKKPASFAGTVADPGGVKGVRVALRPAKAPKKGCRWWSPARKRLVPSKSSCKQKAVSYAATLSGPPTSRRWTWKLGAKLPAGRYTLVVVATDANGNASTKRTTLTARR